MCKSYSTNFSLLCFVLFIGFLQAQDKKTIPDIEKIYLHTDRSIYFIGEDLWYKAYDVRATNNVLYDNSNILYVELIAPDSNIIARNKTNIEMGLGNGDFQLADSLGVKPGHYQIRAYTNWNRNYGEDFVFKKNIEIIDALDPHPKPTMIQSNTAVINAVTTGVQNTITFDFFPEGGSLLENTASVVGFKAVDSTGNSIDIAGDVFDSENELITSFVGPHDGMGKFQIIPIEGKNYYAKIKTLAGAEKRFELPKAVKQGYSLGFRVFRGKNIISINTNPATLLQKSNEKLTVICKAKGISYLETTQTLTENSFSFELSKDKTPDGISQITLYDSNSKPQSERLVYIENEHDLDVQITADKLSYKPNEKAVITVSSKSKTGTAKSASFSMSVTDMNGVVEDKDFGTTISSYFLMESDIRGKVNNPAYYFDSANLKRLEHLDDLLLTQGWRDFLWKTVPIISDNSSYKAEKGITISGRVKQLFGEKPKVNTGMSLTLMNKKGMNFFNSVTDSIGRFKFENIMFSGKTKMFLNSFNEKGKFRGEIMLESFEQAPIPVLFKNEPINWNELTLTIAENVFKKYTAFGIKPENILDEVKIKGSKKNKITVLYGIPDNTYIADETTKTSNTIFQLIEEKISGVVVEGESIRFTRYAGSPLIIIDGYEDRSGLIGFVSPADVVKIEAVKGMQASQVYGAEAQYGIISIFTNWTNGIKPKIERLNSIKQDIEGFYTARVFYVPNPEKPNIELDNNAAVRNTVYWNPYVHPDKTGNTTVNYYNTNVETKVKVALEGITGSGIPVVKKTYYTIKK